MSVTIKQHNWFWSRGVAVYIGAFLIGLAATSYFLPFATVWGGGGLWTSPGGDLAENLTGHLGFQTADWHWPLLLAPNLAWPHGTTIAMTDSNPLLSLIAKAVVEIRGNPANLFGLWLASCWLLQPLAAVYALRGFGCRVWEAELAAAVIAILYPALLARYGHINLMGHFLLLYAVGMTLRLLNSKVFSVRRWLGATILLLASVLCHPYLYVFAATILAAPALQTIINREANAVRTVCGYLASVAIPVASYAVLSGTLGGGDRGFGFYSMNLLSPLWPQRSGLFDPSQPIIDATGGQYEGFNYLGAGGLLLLAVAIVLLPRRFNWRPYRALFIILVALTLLALSSQIYLGHKLILSLGIKPWDQVFGPIRASGRAFWIVGYTLVLASIARIARDLPRFSLRIVLTTAVVLQWIDTAPLRASAREYFAGDNQRPATLSPLSGAHWLSVVPVCTHAGRADEIAAKLRLDAVRAGMWLRDMRVSRAPKWFNCESALTDGTETPLMPREMRVFLEPPATTLFRQAMLGPDVACRGIDQMIVCARGLSLQIGTSVAPGASLPTLDLPALNTSGATLEPLLSYGWYDDLAGAYWSEGPRASLVFRIIPSEPKGFLVLDLCIDGIARMAGGKRPISIRVGAERPIDVTLPDLEPTKVHLWVPVSSVADGIVRIAFDIDHPVDPHTRSLAASVKRAGVRLRSLSVQWTDRPPN
jgi:hypothetical protein